MIANGDFYQTNLTRKFLGKIGFVNKFEIFKKLTELSPASYSAFISFGDAAVISSSPELFLTISKRGKIESHPIKGTAACDPDKSKDTEIKQVLKNSAKEKAENLMIVDLVRNDLSRVCVPGSVGVRNLFRLESYSAVHHLSSTVFGKMASDKSSWDALIACFPPGSMTGAPKIKAMEVAAEFEKSPRGIYSGAIGYFNFNRKTELSVVIRTIVCQGDSFEFQTGGAITYDSNPKAELAEIYSKASRICAALGVSMQHALSIN
jgi:anthranilate/para-aminobenzoate synthase component I